MEQQGESSHAGCLFMIGKRELLKGPFPYSHYKTEKDVIMRDETSAEQLRRSDNRLVCLSLSVSLGAVLRRGSDMMAYISRTPVLDALTK